jgi:hypothetical protein
MSRTAWFLTAAVAALAFVAPATAAQPETVRFETAGILTGPGSASGTWTGTGVVEGTGTYAETFRFAGSTIHAQKVLTGVGGTIVIDIHAVVVFRDACTVTFVAGNWHVSDATGVYEGFKGGGTPGTTAESFGNVCTGVIDVAHEGGGQE